MIAAACGGDDIATTAEASQTAAATTASETSGTALPSGMVAATDDGCPDGNFLVAEVNAYQQTGGYADPELAVRCTGDAIVIGGPMAQSLVDETAVVLGSVTVHEPSYCEGFTNWGTGAIP